MKKLVFLFFIFLFPIFANTNIQTVIHLLTYLSQDYKDAVVDGKVVSESEYGEQLEFADDLVNIAKKEISLPSDIMKSILDLKKQIETKSDPSLVSQLAVNIKSRLIIFYQFPTSPNSWPSLENGKRIYQKNCLNCHGISGGGDGPDGKGLDPAPRNFHDKERMNEISPFQAFNTISLGVSGTSMLGFNELTEKEKWDVSFYVVSLRHENVEKEKNNDFNLVEISSKSDRDLKSKLSDLPIEKRNSRVSYFRTLNIEKKEDVEFFIDKTNNFLNQSLDFYKKGEFEKSEKFAINAYLEGIEPIESFFKGTNLLVEIEINMGNLREGIKKRESFDQILKKVDKVKLTVGEIQKNIEGSKYLPFWLSFGVVFREAMESLLLIISIVTIVRKAKITGAEKYIHGGWIFSIILGIIGYIILDRAFPITGTQIEKLEGFVSLFAAAILLYVGIWFQRQSHMKKWVVLINQKVSSSLSGGSLLGLASISFLVVFREVFETMLFVKILMMQYNSLILVILGILFAILVTIIIGLAFLKFSTKIPLKNFFTVSSLLILGLVLMLISKGIGALQKTTLISSTPFLNSTAEVVAVQLVVLLLGIYILFFQKKEKKVNKI